MLHRITMGLKGGILRVASVAEVAARRLLLLVGGAPGCGRACPALGGLWRLLDMLARRLGCQCATAVGRWRWPPVSVGPGSGTAPGGSPSESAGAAKVPPRRRACTVSCAPVCASALAVAAAASSTAWRIRGSSHSDASKLHWQLKLH